MACLYWTPPPPEYFANNPHHSESDFEEPDCEVWEENWKAVKFYLVIKSQWRVGMNGPYALDYNVMFQRMDRMKLLDDEHEELFQKMQLIEAYALVELRKK